MFLLLLSQGEREIPLAAFETIEDGRSFLELVPGYKKVLESVEDYTFEYETLSPEALPDYLEVNYKGNLVPFTRFMFDSSEDVEVYWVSIPFLTQPNQGVVDGATRVDAYIVENAEVKAYIEQREEGFKRVSKILNKLGYTPGRDFSGSEDGEAIVYKAKGENDFHILEYLDPSFVEVAKQDDEALEAWVKSLLID